MKRTIYLAKLLRSTGVALLVIALAVPEETGAQALDASPLLLSQVPAEAAYTLGPGDRIQVDALLLPEYSGEHEVLTDGTINLPQIGSVRVEGRTLEQAANAITARYTSARILRMPQITVNLLSSRPLKVAVAGEIHRPGSYTLAVEGSRLPTVTQALELAGGITQAADLREVQVRRSQFGTNEVIELNLWQLLQTGATSNDLPLRDGDTIYVPATTQINVEEGPQIATASFAAPQTEPVNVAVLGEVLEPGPHSVTGQGGPGGQPTVTQALQAAGGIQPLADISQIVVRRYTKAGVEQSVELNLEELLQGGDSRQNLILQEGDTVYVPAVSDINLAESSQLRRLSFALDQTEPLNITVVGEVFRPGTYTVAANARTGEAGVPGNASGAGVPTVTRALQVAGGIQPSADVREIQIRRPTSNGAQRTIAVDLARLLEGDSSQDPFLQDGDTIFVPTADEINTAEAARLASASFSPDIIRVNVVGEVENPGIVQVPPNTPLNQALLAAGGFNNRADDEEVNLIRLNPDGSVTREEVPINFAQGVNEQTNPPLRNNDIVVVERSTIASVSDTLDTAVGPLGRFLSIVSFPFQFFRIFD